MKKIFKAFENKRSLAGLFILAGLIFTAYCIQENAAQTRRLSNFESGIQTCFSRVNQTFTANIIADKTSAYLTQNFQNLTEECFAEGILSVEVFLKKDFTNVAKQLSFLASNVHWFHEDILTPESTKKLASNTEVRDVNSRFEKIETTKDEILDVISNLKTQTMNSLNQQKNIFYITATLLVMLILGEYMSMTRRRISNSAREKEAQSELLDNSGVTSVKMGDIIRGALEQNELVNCSKLFMNFYTLANTGKSKNKTGYEDLVVPFIVNGEVSLPKEMEQIWEDDKLGVAADTSSLKLSEEASFEEINLEALGSNLVHILSEKLFSKGVQLDIKIPDGLVIRARQEAVEQALYHLFIYAINSVELEKGEKRISTFAHKLGDVVAFDLTYTGVVFDENLLKQRAGLNGKGGELDLDLEIFQTLLKEMHVKVQLDNKLDQYGNAIGSRIKIVFRAGTNQSVAVSEISSESSSGRLIDLKVGSKKEIMAAMMEKASL